MKNFFKKMAVVMALVMAVSMTAPLMGAYAAEDGIALQGTKKVITEYELQMAGDTVDFCFFGAPEDWRTTYQWTTSNPEVATVDKAGVVTAVSTGTATITITAGADAGYVQNIVVTVYNMRITAGTSAKKAIQMAELKKGQSVDLNFYGVTDWTARKSAYLREWGSSNPDAVSVDETLGIITANKVGTAVVVFYLYDMDKDVLFSAEPVTVIVTE